MTHRGRKAVAAAFVAVLLSVGAVPLASSASAAPTAPARTTVDPICPSTSANGRFVRWIYLHILNRCPDEGGASYWTQQLDDGMGRWVFARRIDYSNENIASNNILPLYGQLLNRAPTPAEGAAAADLIRTSEGDGRLIAQIVSSDESYSHLQGATPQAKDQAFLSQAYNGILDRNPDAAGAAYFTSFFAASGSTEATRRQVAIALEFSGENAEGWVGAVYGAAFQRAPDQAGLAYWTNWLHTTGFRSFRMWTGFLSSDEGFTAAQLQPNPPPQQASKKHDGLDTF